ncbi:MAG: 5-formyltetrahydrofolate cyclo-ligase [Sulfurimonas sp.]|nr:MAG: 5-formyltetrahydrofolate cyclo-ligase [Sulfurimonas sp.]
MPLTKTIFRTNCIKKLKEASTHNKFYNDYHLNKRLQKELNRLKYKSILFYYPLPFEADITKTIKKIRRKCDIFVPFMQGASFKMVPFRLPLKRSKFGIYEAGNSLRNIKKIDIAIVPTVGIDGNLQRIGFGKGMYDRFFAKLNKKPYTIFIQEKICKTNKFICDDYDISCDVLITPQLEVRHKRIISPKAKL